MITTLYIVYGAISLVSFPAYLFIYKTFGGLRKMDYATCLLFSLFWFISIPIFATYVVYITHVCGLYYRFTSAKYTVE